MSRRGAWLSVLFLFAGAPLLSGWPLTAKILLDPGHGGKDSGAVSDFGLKEKDINLKVCLYLAKMLKIMGFEVRLTRETDVYLSLEERVLKSKEFQPDLFFSVHHNSTLGNRNVNKSEVYYKSTDDCVSFQVALFMAESLEALFSPNPSRAIPGNYHVLRHNPHPAVLGEASYLCQPENARNLESHLTLAREAIRYFRALKDYFARQPPRIEFFEPEVNSAVRPGFFPRVGVRVTGDFDPTTLIARVDDEPCPVHFSPPRVFLIGFPPLLAAGSRTLAVTCESATGMKSPRAIFGFEIQEPSRGHRVGEKALFHGRIETPGLDPRSVRVSFDGGAGVRPDENGEFILPLPTGVEPVLRARPPAGWVPITRHDLTETPFTFQRRFPAIRPGVTVAFDWEFEANAVFQAPLTRCARLFSWMGLETRLAADPEFPRGEQDRVLAANQKPTTLFLAFRQVPGRAGYSFRHYPKSVNGSKWVSLAQKHFVHLASRPTGTQDSFGPGSGYALTNTTAAGVVIEGDFRFTARRLPHFLEKVLRDFARP